MISVRTIEEVYSRHLTNLCRRRSGRNYKSGTWTWYGQGSSSSSCTNNLITLYDISNAIPNQAWSPNTWKTRFCLNYKNIAYRTEWIKYPDIENHCIKIGAKPTSFKSGRPLYTLPVIYDPCHGGAVISDSAAIAEYLDTKYPDTPALFPQETKPLQLAFSRAFLSNLQGLYPIILPATHSKLDASGQEYFRRTREKIYGKKLEEMSPIGVIRDGHWKQLKDGLHVVDRWLASAPEGYLIGDSPSYVDIVLAARLMWMKVVFGEGSKEWKDLSEWNGGRWGRTLQMFEKYAKVV